MSGPVLRRLKKVTSTVGNEPTFRIVVLGQSGVGKTAMSVRFVTKRFIGEYDPTLENIYQHSCVIGSSSVLFEIMDTAGQEENDVMMEEKMRWADAFILVYAINDQLSFDEIPRLKFTISHMVSQLHHQHKLLPDPVVTIVGNKCDLELDRMVAQFTAQSHALSLKAKFYEISVRDSVSDVTKVFEETYVEYKRRVTSLSLQYDVSNVSRKKEKSFKYVGRIPRMQGNKRNYVISDVNRESLMRKIDECSENELHNNEFRYNEGKNGETNEQNRTQPRIRRNAVVSFGIGAPDMTYRGGDVIDDVALLKYRRSKVARSASIDDHAGHGSPRLRRHNTTIACYDANNNTRRCKSQEMALQHNTDVTQASVPKKVS